MPLLCVIVEVLLQVVEQNLQTVMVLEDDVRFEPFFRQKVEAILQEIEDIDLVWDLM